MLMLNNYKVTQVKNTEIRLFQTANIVADLYKENIDDFVFTRMMVRSYGKQGNARILVLDSNKRVLIDNHHSYIDNVLDNEEVKKSLNGESASNLYTIKDKEILQLSVPIILNKEGNINVIGAVLISADMVSINNNLDNLKGDILKISTSALLVSLVLTVVATNNLTKPLRRLTLGVEKISSGDLGYRVEKKTNDEVGKLIETFNKMSNTLSKIEKNRKNFINNISHELKTPLTSIKVLIESLSIGNNDVETYKEYLEDIHGETERMEQLVNYLMKTIKLEDTILNLKKENLSTILEDIVKLIAPYANKNEVSINFNASNDIEVQCDKNKIKEVIFNIVDNSIKYKDDKKEDNYVSITLEKAENNAILTIEDNGIGIDEGKLEDIFKRGFRIFEGHVDKKIRIEGYGIGLAIVKNILDKHGWQVSAKGNPGLGSTFIIEIPLV